MSLSYRSKKDFIEAIIPESLLDDAIDWVLNNLQVNDIFSDIEISEYAMDKLNMTNTDNINDFVSKNNIPIIDIFTEDEIREAAREIGIIDINEWREQQISL